MLAEEFLGIFVLTVPDYTARREGVRQQWLNDANRQPGVVARFFLTAEEWTADVAKESASNGDDMVRLDALRSTDYDSLSRKVHASLTWFVANRPARFLFKTDDDVWVNTPLLLVDLQALCLGRPMIDTYEAVQTRLDVQPAACTASARFLYAGILPHGGARTVVTDPGQKYSNVPMYQATGLTQYPYFFGGTGYIISGPLARVLTRPASDDQPPLQFWPREDSTMGFWLLAYNITKLNVGQRIELNSQRDVFSKTNRSLRSIAGQRPAFRTKYDVCDTPVWAVHRVSPSQMGLMNTRLSQCAPSAELWRIVREVLAARNDQTYPPLNEARALPAGSPAQDAPFELRKVFLDIGSRDGHAIEAFALQHPLDFAQYTVHAFEADPRRWADMDLFFQRHPTWSNVRLHHLAASWGGNATSSAPVDGQANGQAGEEQAGQPSDGRKGSQVQTVDLAAFIQHEIIGATRSGLELRGRLDVGGGEFELLPHLLRTGVLGFFTELDVDWYDGRREDMWLWPAQYEDMLTALNISHSPGRADQIQMLSTEKRRRRAAAQH